MTSINRRFKELLVKTFNMLLKVEEDSMKIVPISDLSTTETHTLEAIGIHGPKTMSEVANVLEVTVPTLTASVNRLLKKGYVERRRDVADRRVVLISLTKKGEKAARLHDFFHSKMVDATLGCLTEEEQLVVFRALEKMHSFFYMQKNKIGNRRGQDGN